MFAARARLTSFCAFRRAKSALKAPMSIHAQPQHRLKRKLFLTLMLVPAIPLLAAPGVETTLQRVALSGQPAPGFTDNVRFSNFKYVSLADDGRIAFTADLSGSGISSTNNQGLWAGLPGQNALLAQTGKPLPNSTNAQYLIRLGPPNIDNSLYSELGPGGRALPPATASGWRNPTAP
jgi:hypothetical protein